jgi:hypothetical protein
MCHSVWFLQTCQSLNQTTAPIIAGLPELLVTQIEKARGIPMMVHNGTDDPLMLFDGGDAA